MGTDCPGRARKMKSYKDLFVYQKAFELVLEVYRITKDFPVEEVYGLTSQMRRAAVSIPSNIAEGYRRDTRKEYLRFLNIARGSCAEIECQAALSRALDFMSEADSVNILNIQTEVSIPCPHAPLYNRQSNSSLVSTSRMSPMAPKRAEM
jgi:four helix bundle protein